MPVTSKTYYVLFRVRPGNAPSADSAFFCKPYAGVCISPRNTVGGLGPLKDATRFDTPEAAVARMVAEYGKAAASRYRAVKVTETTGASVREEVPLGATGEDIRYALREVHGPRRVLSADGGWFCAFDGTPNEFSKAVAATYATPSDALVALQQNSRKLGYSVSALTLVALRETTPTTVTVEYAPEPPKYNFVTFNTPESTAVKSIAYDATAKVAQVALVGGTYEYTDVSPADVFAFLGAPSKGSHFNKVWKPKYGRPNTKV